MNTSKIVRPFKESFFFHYVQASLLYFSEHKMYVAWMLLILRKIPEHVFQLLTKFTLMFLQSCSNEEKRSEETLFGNL